MSANPVVKEFIATKATTASDDQIRRYFLQMKELYDKKLWHQLTIKLVAFVKLPQFDRGRELIEFYERFIRDFEAKINQMELVKIVLSILRQIQDPNEAVAWLQRISEKISSENEKEAYSYILAEISWLKLNLNALEEIKSLTEKIAVLLDSITGADPLVYSAYYRVLSLYYKKKVAPTEFYRNSLLFLVYTPLEQIPVNEQSSLAFDMGLAALVSTDIHNFGELLANPILKSLEGTKNAWLKDFLFAFNRGDLDSYDKLLIAHKKDIEAQAALVNNLVLMRQKICILALMELVFNKPSDGRTLPFKIVAQATKLKEDEVELLVMKALSVKLIRGEIDEVNQTITVRWVQPRVLDMGQIKKMEERVALWSEEVNSVLNYVQNETAPELLT